MITVLLQFNTSQDLHRLTPIVLDPSSFVFAICRGTTSFAASTTLFYEPPLIL